MPLEQAISRAIDLVNEPGNSRLSALDCEAILTLASFSRGVIEGFVEEERASLTKGDSA